MTAVEAILFSDGLKGSLKPSNASFSEAKTRFPTPVWENVGFKQP